jgi:hypothetical protein
MRALTPLCSFVLTILGAAACGADLGGGFGFEARSARPVGYGRAAASTKLGTPLNDHGILLGGSLESRTEAKLGVRYDAGLMLGWGTGPATLGGKWGVEMYVEAGTPIHGGFFRNEDWFIGSTLAAPFHIGVPREVADLNSSTWFATNRVEFVPMARVRIHWDHPDVGEPIRKVDLQMGAALRLRMLSDLF